MDTPIVPQKQCTKCKQYFAATTENFYPKKRGKYGFTSQCKTCISLETGHKPREKYLDGFWRCSACKELLPLTNEYFVENRTHKTGFGSECKGCNNKRSHHYYHDNKDDINKRSRDRLKTDEEYRDRKRAIARKAQSKRKDKMRIYNQEWQQKNWTSILEYKRQWAKDNPEKVRYARRVYRIVRTARIRGNGDRATTKQVKELYVKQEGKCYWCGIDTNGKYHIDHIHPVSRGGSSAIWNLCVSCKKCNQLKSNLTVEQWLIKLEKIKKSSSRL